MTMVAWADVTVDGVSQIGVVPCLINSQGQAVPAAATTDDGQRVLRYLAWTCTNQGLQVSIEPDDRAIGGIHGAVVAPA